MLAYALTLIAGAGDTTRTLPLLVGVAVLFVVGTIDDKRTVLPSVRVAVEFGLGMLLAAAGLAWHLGAGYAVDALVNGIWVVAVVNAFNLFDNMDGAASTMAIVVAAAACVLGIVTGNAWVAAGSAALCGACLGFLPHNLASPARIFLGDGGSMPLGFAVAALVATAARSAEPSVLALMAGFMLVGIPALDTSLVIVSRRRRGVSILTGGQDHLTHRTRKRMRTARRVVLVLGSAQAIVSALVIVATRESSAALVYSLLAFVVCAGATIGALESVEAGKTGVSAPADVLASRASPRGVAASAVLFVLGLGAGVSPLFEGYYNQRTWLPIGFVLVIIAAAGMIARPPRLGRPAIFTLAGLAGFGLLSLLSGSWAAAVEQATTEGNRWLSYAAFVMVLFVFLRRRKDAMPLLVGAALGVAIVAATILVRLLGSDPVSLFVSGRLNSPLGYINGEGCVFAMGCWLGLALAERRKPWFAGIGAAYAVAMACLALLSQSRGAAIATFLTGVVVLLFLPGRRRRVFAIALIAAGVAAAGGPLLHVYSLGNAGTLTARAAHSAALAIVLAAVATGAVWAGLVAAAQILGERMGFQVGVLQRTATIAAIVVVGIPIVAAVVRFGSIEHTVKNQWHAFVHLSDNGSVLGTQTRLLSGAGNRYDYWRVAWKVFVAHPAGGVGAGNYPAQYYRYRRTQEAIENPHSLELQLLSELGVIGAALLPLSAVGVALGARRLGLAARTSANARTAAVAALGVTVAWFVDASGDWMHLLPGITAIALTAIAVLAHEGSDEPRAAEAAPRRRWRVEGRYVTLGAAAALAFVLAVAGASFLRSELTHIYVDRAHAELAAHPAKTLTDANRALTLDASNIDAYYFKAAAYARFNQAGASRGTLLQATAQDPTNFVTWTLLGDLEVRLRNFAAAKTFYENAHVLDPNDPTIAALANDPKSALSSG
jgi:UDP-GlcNAc:undecaprenyl-phosphate GlcNAc-1-phosphate transferase